MPLYSGGLCEAVKLMAPSALLANHGVGNRRGGRGLGNHQRRDAVSRQNVGRHGAERLAEKTRIAAHDDPRARGLLRNHVTRNAITARRHIGEGKFLGHHRAPSGSAELDLHRHAHPSLMWLVK